VQLVLFALGLIPTVKGKITALHHATHRWIALRALCVSTLASKAPQAALPEFAYRLSKAVKTSIATSTQIATPAFSAKATNAPKSQLAVM